MTILSLGHLIGLVATIVLILAVTFVAAPTAGTSDEFSLSGRGSSAAMIAGSISGTCVGGAATLGSTQMAFSFGLYAWWFTLGIGIGLLTMAAFYARAFRRSGLETMPQFLGKQYGRNVLLLTSFVSSLGTLFSVVAAALSGVALFGLLFGLSPLAAAAALVVLVSATVAFGGLKGASVSGLLKMAILALALIVGGAVACLSLWRLDNFAAVFPAVPWFDMTARGLGDCIGNLGSLTVGMITTQAYIQAVYSATDARTAAVGAFAAAMITIPVGLPCVAIGMAMHAAHPDLPSVLALPVFLLTYLPSWLGGIGLAGILFSIVGSIAGLVLGIGTMIANDFGRGLFGLTEDRHVLLLNRLTVVAVVALGTAIALANPDSFILDWNYLSMGLRAAGVFLPLTLAIFWPYRLTPRWAATSMAAATVVAVIGRFGLGLTVNPLLTGLAVSAALVGLGLLLTAAPAGAGSDRRRNP